MAYAPTVFIWDNVLAHKQTVRVYGEFVTAKINWKDPAKKQRPTFLECYRDFIDDKREIEVEATAAIQSLQPHRCPDPAATRDDTRATARGDRKYSIDAWQN
jgi:hypothetical protein